MSIQIKTTRGAYIVGEKEFFCYEDAVVYRDNYESILARLTGRMIKSGRRCNDLGYSKAFSQLEVIIGASKGSQEIPFDNVAFYAIYLEFDLQFKFVQPPDAGCISLRDSIARAARMIEID